MDNARHRKVFGIGACSGETFCIESPFIAKWVELCSDGEAGSDIVERFGSCRHRIRVLTAAVGKVVPPEPTHVSRSEEISRPVLGHRRVGVLFGIDARIAENLRTEAKPLIASAKCDTGSEICASRVAKDDDPRWISTDRRCLCAEPLSHRPTIIVRLRKWVLRCESIVN